MELQDTKIAMIGLGYVGLPLAVAMAEKYPVTGFDISTARVAELRSGQDSSLEVTPEALAASSLGYTSELADIADCNVYIVTVPTPIDESKTPDLRPLHSASTALGGILKKGDVVVFESTVYPGATEEYCIPIMEQISGLTYNQDFFAGYSPERINPGDKEHRVTTILKVTSGSTPEIADYVERPIAIVCRTDRRSAKAARLLTRKGFVDVHVVKGGMTDWNQAGYGIEL